MNISAFHKSIQSRPRPEDVAELILGEVEGLPAALRTTLRGAARHSTRSWLGGYSSMSTDFRRPDGAGKQVKTGSELFGVPMLSAAECMDSTHVRVFLQEAMDRLQVVPGKMDFKANRLTRDQRASAGLPEGHRAYNKRFRYLQRLSDKIERMVRSEVKFGHTQQAKSGFATRLTEADLQDPASTAFVAYMTARMNLRSQFTDSSQVRAFDTVAEALFRHAAKGENPNWWAMAHVHPEREVLAHLTDEQKGRFLSMAFESLLGIARFLQVEAETNKINLGDMVVHRGQDSSTWNATAGAWNKARSNWFDILFAMGAEDILMSVCPGKVLRLMAADVVRWHSEIHPDTHVWKDLPKPWAVLLGETVCTRDDVARACDAHSVSRAGWCSPRPDKKAHPFTVTPELVHGVTVSSPALARLLRKAGVFSGQGVKGPVPDVEITRTPDGYAVFVEEKGDSRD